MPGPNEQACCHFVWLFVWLLELGHLKLSFGLTLTATQFPETAKKHSYTSDLRANSALDGLPRFFLGWPFVTGDFAAGRFLQHPADCNKRLSQKVTAQCIGEWTFTEP